jgi:hypothetical protein
MWLLAHESLLRSSRAVIRFSVAAFRSIDVLCAEMQHASTYLYYPLCTL